MYNKSRVLIFFLQIIKIYKLKNIIFLILFYIILYHFILNTLHIFILILSIYN